MPGPGAYGNKKAWMKQVKLAAMKRAKDRLHKTAKGIKKS